MMAKSKAAPDDLLSAAQAAAELGVGQSRMSLFLNTGRLPGMRIGKVWVIRRGDLEAVGERKTGRPRKSPEVAKGEAATGDKKKPIPKKKPKRS